MVNIFDIPVDIFGVIGKEIGRLGGAVLWRTCKQFRRYIRPRDRLHRSSILNDAAAQGHLNIIKWSMTLGCIPGKTTLELAAAGGHTTTLKWLVEAVGMPVKSRVMLMAVSHGHIDTVIYLRTITNMTYEMSRRAAKNGDAEMVKYMINSNFTHSPDQMFYSAFTASNMDTIGILMDKYPDLRQKYGWWLRMAYMSVLHYS